MVFDSLEICVVADSACLEYDSNPIAADVRMMSLWERIV